MSIYSVVAIAHRWGGYGRAELTSSKLFGSPGAGLRHDFPSHLQEFCSRTGSAFGDPEQLALNATVLPYFLRFRPPAVRAEAIALMLGDSVEPLKFVLGLPQGPSGACMLFSSCMDCAAEDKFEHGYAYWHLRHQLPGVYVCPDHGSPLLLSILRENGRGRSSLYLPDDREIVTTSSSLVTNQQLPLLKHLAELSAESLKRDLPGGYSPTVLLATYRYGLKQQGLLTPGGYVRAAELVKWLRDRYASIADLDTFNRIIDKKHVEGMLGLVRKPRGNRHTASHLLLIDALFGSWDMFASAYAWQSQMELPLAFPVDIDQESTVQFGEAEIIITQLVERYKNGEGSISALSREYGIDVNTAMRWMGRLGLIDVPRRPHILTREIRTAIIQSIRAGEPLKNIAKKFSLSRSTIDRVCNDIPGLPKAWRAANLEYKRNIERAKLEACIQASPQITRDELREHRDSGFGWLMRHDKQWLNGKIPANQTVRQNNTKSRRTRVDWAGRDQECVSALRGLGSSLRFESWERLKPMTLLRKITKLSFSPRLDRLPLSKVLVTEMLNEAAGKRTGTI
jgi:hypothetical protein